MKKIFVPCLLLLLATAACQKRAVTAHEDDVLARVCDIEKSRHGETGGGIVLFGNRAMDEYRRAPGSPRHLVKALGRAEGVCRGALIQLLTVFHFDYLDQRFFRITATWREQDWVFFANALSQTTGPLFERYTLVLLDPERPAAVRKIAVNRLSQFDQAPHEKMLGRLVRAYRDDSQLSHLLLHLDLVALPASTTWFADLFDHANPDVHRDIMLAWSTSERDDKSDLIARYLNHGDPGVRRFAESLTAQLAGQDKLTMRTEVRQIQVTKNGDQTDLNQGFIEAVYQLDLQAMESALDNGAELNSRDNLGTPALILLLNLSSFRAVPKQYTPLVRARGLKIMEQREQALAAAQFLLGLGADVNIATESGETPLYMAAMYGNKVFATLLLNHGADPSLRNSAGFTPLDIARTLENQRMVELLR
ncbi:ankyrin repeat domain-containing protein [Acanthopleuribacter pedis]|uniref:Ankyrin repeat domain-containing protein n=1 Tax=Acanthopleuribacter pedis TaxID=442870 RepID=A0A8J7U268_9BACT|nr:ankyrin repeat domain-containing protein [Acanthopleuribacter pedis]